MVIEPDRELVDAVGELSALFLYSNPERVDPRGLAPKISRKAVNAGVESGSKRVDPSPKRVDPSPKPIDPLAEIEERPQQRCCQEPDGRPRLRFHDHQVTKSVGRARYDCSVTPP